MPSNTTGGATQQELAQQEGLDKAKIVEDTLKLVADAIILSCLHTHYDEKVPGSTPNLKDALTHLHGSITNLTGTSHENFIWENERENFVDNF